jgi:Tol biopolymer transport system component
VLTGFPATQYDITPDGAWIYYHGTDAAGKYGLYRVPTSGGAAERMGDTPVQTRDGTMRISPDGHKIALASNDESNGFETWSLENFVPAEPKR